MDFFLNKIDPQIVNIIKQTTATGVVHRKDDVPVQKEEKDRESGKDKKDRRKKIRKQIEKLNQLVNKNELDIFFVLEDMSDELLIKVYEKKTDNCIKIFQESEIEDLISRLQNIMGIIIDVKG